MADLITRNELKTALNIPLSDTTRDAALDQAIAGASAVIRAYTGRNFASADTDVTKTYFYDGSGFLEVDDLDPTAPIIVALDGVTLTVDKDYLLMPDRGISTPDAEAAYEWIELVPSSAMSPAMGFTYNLDTLWWKYRQHHRVAVTGRFGWPTVPGDVKQAAIWTAAYFLETPRPYISVTVSDFSQTFASPTPNVDFPERAKDLLAPYRRYHL